tara:strand:+ start:179 stop:571 length:393 start_codon:yes stop_codon:yes gene_type:complete
MILKSHNKINPNFSMSSMTDIVFLLLIFFMLTSTLVTTNALEIILPSSSAQPLKKQSVSVSITEDLRYFVNNDSVERLFLDSKLKAVMNQDNDVTIILRASKSIPYEFIVEVMDIAYKNGYKIVLATQSK